MATRRKTISERQLKSLARKLKALSKKADSTSVDAKLKTYWTYGDLIVGEELLENVGYHHSILRDLSVDTGISLRMLQHSVAFRKSYRRPPLDTGLSWAHVRLLASLPSKRLREFYSRLAKKEEWTSAELRKAINAELHSTGSKQKPKLKRPREASYLYKAKQARVVDGDTVELLVDLGFRSFTLQRIRLAKINAPEIRTAAGRSARSYLAELLHEAKTLVIQTLKSDLHGRYVAYLFASPRKLSIDACFTNGLFINDALLREKHARLIG